MRQFIFLCALVLMVQGGPAVAVDKPDLELDTTEGVDFSVLPSGIDALRDLDAEHRYIARRAARMCSGVRGSVPRTGLYADPCVRRNVETAVERANDPELTAFHYALPVRVRYDGLRTEPDWRGAVESRIAQTEELEWQHGGR